MMGNEIDRGRADWEGKGNPESGIMNPDLSDFLGRVRDTFYADPNVWGAREAAVKVLTGMEVDEKIKLLIVIRESFEKAGEVTVENLESFLKGEGAEDLRNNLHKFLGGKKWEDFEKEGASRNMRHDQTFGGTPG